MKKNYFMKIITIFLIFIFFSTPSIAKNIIHPLDFKGSAQEKENVISFIEKNVNEIYCDNEITSGMCSNSILRMMEEEELDSFKKLTKVKEESILNNVIQTYCHNTMLEDMCMYTTILMMYEEEVRASSENLSW